MNNSVSYLEFLKFCLNDGIPAPECAKNINWHSLLEFGVKHTISGLFAPTILLKNGKLKREDFKDNKPSDEDVMEWVFEDYRLRKLNQNMFERAGKAAEWFAENGFRNCILKGQGNALMYPDPGLRTPGDIDIWLEGGREKILEFTTKYYNKHASKIHVDFPMFKDAPVEVHFTPSTLKNPFTNKKLQRYFISLADAQFTNKTTTPDGKISFCTPTTDFNVVYQLIHLYRHLITRGIGLRQVIDYFYLLRKRKEEGFTEDDNRRLRADMKRFKLLKFAGAISYILHEMLGLGKEYLVVPPDKKEGVFILNEILEGGNFGKYERRIEESLEKTEGHFKRFLVLEAFNFRLLSHYPSEVMWMPILDLKRSWKNHHLEDDD